MRLDPDASAVLCADQAEAAPSSAEAQRKQAVAALRRCCHPLGLKASGARGGHDQVWARDSMIALLGACLLDDEPIRAALRTSLRTLGGNQAPTGAIPNNVDISTGKPNFRAYADAGLWFVIGACALEPDLERIERVLDWYECQDVDQSGLLSMQEAAEAARLAGRDELASRWFGRAGLVRTMINRLMWHCGDGDMHRHVCHSFSTDSHVRDALGRKRWIPAKRILAGKRYYLPYLSFREAGEWFDVLGHLLAVLSGEPMGVPDQAWSAGMFIYAVECVRRGQVLFL